MPRKKKMSQEQSSKRLVLVTGNKGGTGKSTFARALLDVYRHYQIKCLAYDGDKTNAQLYRHYDQVEPGVVLLDIYTVTGVDRLIEDLDEKQPTVALVDLPAGSGDAFEKLESKTGLFADAASMGYRTTTVSVLSRVKDSVNTLRLLMQYCGDRVDYIAVKNLYYGAALEFARFDNSKTRGEFTSRGGIEIVLPSLVDLTYDQIDEKDLTFREALNGNTLTRPNRSRVKAWLQEVENELERVGNLLALPQPVAKAA
jgi:energy-coupling factor transporter ATP-binding protein EcfA2